MNREYPLELRFQDGTLGLGDSWDNPTYSTEVHRCWMPSGKLKKLGNSYTLWLVNTAGENGSCIDDL